MENYLKENSIDNITGGPYNSQHKGGAKHLIKLPRFFISAKDHHLKNFVSLILLMIS